MNQGRPTESRKERKPAATKENATRKLTVKPAGPQEEPEQPALSRTLTRVRVQVCTITKEKHTATEQETQLNTHKNKSIRLCLTPVTSVRSQEQT